MRVSVPTLAKYVPKKTGPPSPHPCAPNQLMPTKAGSSTASSARSTSNVGPVPFESRNFLSSRFRYSPLDEIEIEDVNTGGAEYLIR
ncbi:hypothetical protein KL921_001917 [Ogataea angusta]|uniref:Uncharacterized protein n=1 Tax=Pichia angusta TaxID=870730 RepID=A0ABQ7RYR5_PICAN|nr:hypothetical protein KL921_001917 [Ogataea angusta]KAG7840354.1 hypothetical protein KL942_002305 [Ogataea angusta]KAG7848736.1 hypothetical protein KL941_001554 [Ogataea angusta]KAG7850262.1 hypothetical protein KL940_001822 [Ogataea angusta]